MAKAILGAPCFTAHKMHCKMVMNRHATRGENVVKIKGLTLWLESILKFQ